MDPTRGPDSWTQLVDPTPGHDSWTQLADLIHGPNLWTRLFHPICGALKTMSGSGLDSWIVHSWELFDLWIVPAWTLKNKELFWIGLVDNPRTEP